MTLRTLLYGALRVAGAVAITGCSAAFADALPAGDYYLSLRSLTQENAPRFVQVSATSVEQYATQFQPCDDYTVYVSDADVQTVQDALANQDIVQLHVTATGTSPETGSILCMVQAGQ